MIIAVMAQLVSYDESHLIAIPSGKAHQRFNNQQKKTNAQNEEAYLLAIKKFCRAKF
jgi:hypothetical protein